MEETTQPKKKKRWAFRFSLATLLMLVTLTAGYFSGYHMGTSQLELDQQAAQAAKLAALFKLQAYQVGHLFAPIDQLDKEITTEDFDGLIEIITSTVEPDTWMVNGIGEGEIQPIPSNKTLVIFCSGSTHEQVAKLLQQLRDFCYNLPEDYLKTILKVDALKKPKSQIIKLFTVTSPVIHQRMQNHFQSALNHLSKEFGKPNQNVTAGEPNFPTWIGAQQVVVWNRPNGCKFYFALTDCRPTGEAIIVGWRDATTEMLKPITIAVSN